jgi:hypothetical protein
LADDRGGKIGWAWGPCFVDLDNDGFLDASGGFIMKDVKNWSRMNDLSLAGYQHKYLFYNNHKGEFIDIASRTDLGTDLHDSRGIVAIDYMNTGSPSLIIANQNGEAQFYQNKQKNKKSWIGFKFKGKKVILMVRDLPLRLQVNILPRK